MLQTLGIFLLKKEENDNREKKGREKGGLRFCQTLFMLTCAQCIYIMYVSVYFYDVVRF